MLEVHTLEYTIVLIPSGLKVLVRLVSPLVAISMTGSRVSTWHFGEVKAVFRECVCDASGNRGLVMKIPVSVY
jgi:hypothetical protein